MKKQLLAMVVAIGLVAVASQAAMVVVASGTAEIPAAQGGGTATFQLAYYDNTTSSSRGYGVNANTPGYHYYGLFASLTVVGNSGGQTYTIDGANLTFTGVTSTSISQKVANKPVLDEEGQPTGEFELVPTLFNDNNAYIAPGHTTGDSQFSWSTGQVNLTAGNDGTDVFSAAFAWKLPVDGGPARTMPMNVCRVVLKDEAGKGASISGSLAMSVNGDLTKNIEIPISGGINVPEPATLALVSMGGLALLRRRK